MALRNMANWRPKVVLFVGKPTDFFEQDFFGAAYDMCTSQQMGFVLVQDTTQAIEYIQLHADKIYLIVLNLPAQSGGQIGRLACMRRLRVFAITHTMLQHGYDRNAVTKLFAKVTTDVIEQFKKSLQGHFKLFNAAKYRLYKIS